MFMGGLHDDEESTTDPGVLKTLGEKALAVLANRAARAILSFIVCNIIGWDVVAAAAARRPERARRWSFHVFPADEVLHFLWAWL